MNSFFAEHYDDAQEILHSLAIEEAEEDTRIHIGSGEDNHIVMFPDRYKEVLK